MKLFEINFKIDDLLNRIYEAGGEITEEQYEELNQLELEQSEKIDSWCYFIKQKKADLKAAKELLDGMTERYKAMEHSLERTKDQFTVLLGGEKFKSAFNSVYYTTRESIELDDGYDINNIPKQYLNFGKPVLNKTAISEAMENGEQIAGVHKQSKTSTVIR